MREWIRFFIGTPQRFLVTLAGVLFLFWALFPDTVNRAVQPLVNPLLQFAVVILAFGIIARVGMNLMRGPKKK